MNNIVSLADPKQVGDEEKRGTFGPRAEQTAKYLHLKIQMNAAPFR